MPDTPDQAAHDQTPALEGYHRMDGIPDIAGIPGGLPPIMLCENIRTHPDLETFLALLKYAHMPRPIAMMQTGPTGDDSTDYYAVITGANMPETHGCRILTDGDRLLHLMHGSDCPRTASFREAILTGRSPRIGGCAVDALLQYVHATGDISPLPFIPMPDIPLISDPEDPGHD